VPTPVAVAVGSNLGDRRSHLYWAVEQLGRILRNIRASSFIETEPVDVPDPQPPYLNGAVVGETSLEPRALLDALLAIERERGRERLTPRAARTLDLDLILYGDRFLNGPDLVVPHPRFRERRFVLQPLAEIASDWIDPVTGKTVKELLEEV
jgi:2-amino-4-hydroxy-6-hydroxymethyldihydropteridine diphosphokinase